MPVSLRADYPLGTARGCTCYICGADRGIAEPVIDCHREIVGEGVLRICASCVIEAAHLLGMIHPEARDEAIASMHELQAAADEAVAERDEARALVDQVLRWDEKHVPVGPVGTFLPSEPAHEPTTEKPARKRGSKAPA